jgi:hypothetical protein
VIFSLQKTQQQQHSLYRQPVKSPPFYHIKHIPKSINKRISSLSSDQSSFDSSAPLYEDALHRSNYNVKLQYSTNSTGDTPTPNRKKRQRKMIWFNPPFSKNVQTNVAHSFLQLIDKHFPHSTRLHKIFNRNTVKVSYSCMTNIKNTISNHNRHLLVI